MLCEFMKQQKELFTFICTESVDIVVEDLWKSAIVLASVGVMLLLSHVILCSIYECISLFLRLHLPQTRNGLANIKYCPTIKISG